MAQFCYLRPYLGIENVFCRLLLRIGTYSSFYAISAKITEKNIMVSGPWWNVFDMLFITLQEHSVYGSRH